MRFILIDRITNWEIGKQAEAIKNIALSEDFFDDHFPLRPIMPGVLILEGLAEVAGLLLEETVREQLGRNLKALLSIIEKAKFRDFVIPGDCLTYRATIKSVNDFGGKIEGVVFREEKRIGNATLIFSFREIENPALDARRNELLKFWLDLKHD